MNFALAGAPAPDAALASNRGRHSDFAPAESQNRRRRTTAVVASIKRRGLARDASPRPKISPSPGPACAPARVKGAPASAPAAAAACARAAAPPAAMAARARTVYLLAYNSAQALLWLHTLALLALHVPAHVRGGGGAAPRAVAALYAAVSPSALAAQRLSWLEVLHAAAGLTGGGASAAFVQALGRSAVLLVLVPAAASARASPAAPLLIAAAAVSDVTRYAFYVAALAGAAQPWLTAARYSTFLPAYPVGIACEWTLYFVSLAEVDARGLFRVALPNKWNFAFDYGVWNRGVLASYAYFGPSMFMYMLRQRRKKLA